MNDLEADLMIAKAEIAALKKGKAFAVPEDYVKVVRCRDCQLQRGCQVGQLLGDDGYCSFGERRKDNG